MERTWEAYVKDAHRGASCRAAKESCLSTASAAKANKRSRRTVQRWFSTGPSPLENGTPFECDKPERVEAFKRVSTLLDKRIRGLDRAHLMATYREAWYAAGREAMDDVRVALDPELGWLDRGAYFERMMANLEVLAACSRRFAQLGITHEEVQREAFGA